MVPESVLNKFIDKIDPTHLVLLIVVYFLMKLIIKRDAIIVDLTSEMSENNKIMTQMTETIKRIFNKDR